MTGCLGVAVWEASALETVGAPGLAVGVAVAVTSDSATSETEGDGVSDERLSAVTVVDVAMSTGVAEAAGAAEGVGVAISVLITCVEVASPITEVEKGVTEAAGVAVESATSVMMGGLVTSDGA